jgi:7-carboxy-7-deazaguanine synthase
VAGLRVIEVFDSLQGEGYWTGTPMTFVRLAGCNAPEAGLECVRWCDTPGSWDAASGECLSVAAIIARVHFPRLCLTGGEPLLQPAGVAELVAEARRCGIRAHLETNGTLPPPAGPEAEDLFDWVVVSPKPPAYRVAPAWEGFVDELKLVVDEGLDAALAERLAAEHPEAVVSIQPVWERECGAVGTSTDAAGQPIGPATAHAITLVMEHPDWRLSLQTHKYLGIR